MAKFARLAVAPNVAEDGCRVAMTPARVAGGWRGRVGYPAIQPILARTRFKIRPDADSPELWTAWNLVAAAQQAASDRRMPPLICRVCGDVPERLSFMNLVSSSKSSGQCSCSFRPEHCTLEGLARLEALVGAAQHSLVDQGGADWVRVHMHRSPRWHFVHLRCTPCKRERHVPSSGLLRGVTKITPCLCVRTSPARRAGKKAASQPPTPTQADVGEVVPLGMIRAADGNLEVHLPSSDDEGA